jgi:hypothetical protein
MTTIRFLLKLPALAAIAFLVGVTSTGVSANTITMANYNGGNGTPTVDCTLSCEGFVVGATPPSFSLSTTDAIDFPLNGNPTDELAKLNELLAGLATPRDPVTYVNKTDLGGNGFTTDRQYFSIKQGVFIWYLENTSGGTLTVDLGPDTNDYSHWTEYGPVSAVPVPAAVWLFGTALIGFVGMSRRTKVA